MNNIYNEYSLFVTNNKKHIELSKNCTCIQCKETFKSEQIILFIYSNSTGVCPYCKSDLIIPDYFEIDDKQNKIDRWNRYIVFGECNFENTKSPENNHVNKKRKL